MQIHIESVQFVTVHQKGVLWISDFFDKKDVTLPDGGHNVCETWMWVIS